MDAFLMIASADGEPMTLGLILLYLLGITVALLGNAFFVAAEFAVARVRPSQFEETAKSKPRRTAAARYVVAHLDSFLSACQFGITIFSLILGFLGEPLIERIVGPMLKEWFPVLKTAKIPLTDTDWVKAISFTIAIVSFTTLHVIIGELVPKSLAIRRALGTSLSLSRPLIAFSKVCSIPIRMMNGAANWILIHVFRTAPVSEHGHAHSAEELAYLVEESERSQHVTETEREILENALGLNEVWVRDIMTHRSEVVVIEAGEPFDSILELVRTTKHTRFPLVNDHLDDAIGFIHVKDVLRIVGQPKPNITSIKRNLKVVPETMPLDMLLKFFLKEKTSLALVADEFGHAAGVVFLDNVIEKLVGDIQDEFDNEGSPFIRLGEGQFVTDGTTALVDLADYEEELYLESGEVTTVGGYITQQLGRFPEVNETILINGWEAKVTSTDDRRVGQIHFRKLSQEPEDAGQGGEPD